MTSIGIHKIFNFFMLMGCFIVIAPIFASAEIVDLKKQIKQAEDQIIIDNAQNNLKSKGQNIVVIELFTAPDCSACIYADRMLYDAMKKENVIGLSCYIASQKNRSPEDKKSDNETIDKCIFRQWSYSRGGSSDYGFLKTPEFVFNGSEKIGSTSLSRFDESLGSQERQVSKKILPILVQWHDEDTLVVNLPEADSNDDSKISSSIYLVRYKDMMVEKIKDEGSKDRVLRFSNIIQDIKHIGKWHRKSRTIYVDVQKPLGGKEKGGYAVLIQKMLGDDILGAGKVSDYSVSEKK